MIRVNDLVRVITLHATVMTSGSLTYLVGCGVASNDSARHMAGKDENNAKEMGELVQTADKLKHDYQCAVMLVHHTGHNNQDRARGSTAFKGALDTEILVKSLEKTTSL